MAHYRDYIAHTNKSLISCVVLGRTSSSRKLSNNGSESQNWRFSNLKIMLCIDGYVKRKYAWWIKQHYYLLVFHFFACEWWLLRAASTVCEWGSCNEWTSGHFFSSQNQSRSALTVKICGRTIINTTHSFVSIPMESWDCEEWRHVSFVLHSDLFLSQISCPNLA